MDTPNSLDVTDLAARAQWLPLTGGLEDDVTPLHASLILRGVVISFVDAIVGRRRDKARQQLLARSLEFRSRLQCCRALAELVSALCSILLLVPHIWAGDVADV